MGDLVEKDNRKKDPRNPKRRPLSATCLRLQSGLLEEVGSIRSGKKAKT